MQNNRRQFFIFDIEVAARKAGATIPAMTSLVPVFEQMHANARTYAIRNSTGTMLIGDINIDNVKQLFVLLIRLSDKDAPNSVYSDPVTGQFNEHLKTGNVGSDFGCHVIISTAPEDNVPNVYTCAIERVPGLPFDLVRRLLSKLLNVKFNEDPNSFTYQHPAGGLNAQGQPRLDRCCPHIELRGRPSDSLIHDINNGRLTGVTLVKAEVVTPIAGAPFLKKAASELKLDIDHNSVPANVWNSLKGALNQQSGVYGTAKVSYRVPGSARIVTVELDAASGNPLADLYVRQFEITNIFPFLAQSAKQIVSHLRDLAIPQFIANRTI